MSRGINLAENTFSNYRSFSNNGKPVVFLSHKSEDSDYVKEIGNYLMDAGIDIYLDKNDPVLQRADREGDARKVTKCIEEGIANCDYILCIVSQATVESWWVPYEIGYGKKSNKQISSLIRKDVSDIPDYLKIEDIIDTIEGMNKYIREITRRNLELFFESTNSLPEVNSRNRLARYLKVR